MTRGQCMVRRAPLVAAAAAWLLLATPVQAWKTGIVSTVFDGIGCPLCHSSGTTPTVLLEGPTTLQPGETATYTFTIFSIPSQNFGGLNVSADEGTLATGGPFAAGTRTALGLLNLVEITHEAPKQGDFLSTIEFSFRWTAPAHGVTATLRAWGNAVNLDNSPLGDAAATTTLAVSVDGPMASSPTPSATPTATPIPFTCADRAPPNPLPPTLPAAIACQSAIAKLGALYVKKDLKAVQQCMRELQRGVTSADPIERCIGRSTALPSDATTAGAIARAQDKVRKQLPAKCSIQALQTLDGCATADVGLEACFLAQHRQVVIDAIAAQYGRLMPNGNKKIQKCQAALAAGAGRYLVTQLAASEKCLVTSASTGGGAARCIGSIAGGSFLPPADATTAGVIAKARAKLASKLNTICADGELAPLDACAHTVPGVLDCLLCTHQTAVFDALASEFGGAP